jgi:N-acetylglucosamine kinase-like BadF-type ATPase
MAIFVGLDCGGSSSRVLAIDEQDMPIFRGQSGPANLLSTPESVLLQNLTAATSGCPEADSVCGCFAGLVGQDVTVRAIEHLRTLFPAAKTIRVEPDYAAALAACGNDADACVIAGTGSVICSRSAEGLVKSGGRGPILGDPGSAAEIGRETLSAYLDDPHAFSPAFREKLIEVFGSEVQGDIVSRIYSAPSPAASLAKLESAASCEALAGNLKVQDLIQQEMRALAGLLTNHLQSFRLSTAIAKVGLAGGLWKSGPHYREAFEANWIDLNPKMTIELFILRKAPVEGAAQLAKEAHIGH